METKTLGTIQLIIGIVVVLIGAVAIIQGFIGDAINIRMDDITYVLLGIFAIITATPNLKK